MMVIRLMIINLLFVEVLDEKLQTQSGILVELLSRDLEIGNQIVDLLFHLIHLEQESIMP